MKKIDQLILLFLSFGIWSLVIGQTLNSVLLFMSSMYFAEIKLKFKVDYGYIKDLFYFGGGITLSRVFNYLAVAGDRIILGNTVNLEFLGFFNKNKNSKATPKKLPNYGKLVIWRKEKGFRL